MLVLSTMASFIPKDLSASALTLITLLILVFSLWVFIKWFLPKPKVSDFHKKHVLITGCDSGFGKKTAILLDHLGFHVIATCLTTEGRESLHKACSHRVISFMMDVTDSKQVQNVYEEVKRTLPSERGLWAVVNNAGYMTLGPLEWFKLDEYKRMADVNLWGLIDVTKIFLPLVKKAKGRIVNFSSVAGLISAKGRAPYSITKYGVEAFSDALRREMVTWDVKVCILEPQAFQTALWTEIAGKKLQSLWDELSDEMKAEYGEDYLKKDRQRYEKHLKNNVSSDTDSVVNAVVDAITSRDPKTRYLIGPEARYLALKAVLPTSLQDYFLQSR